MYMCDAGSTMGFSGYLVNHETAFSKRFHKQGKKWTTSTSSICLNQGCPTSSDRGPLKENIPVAR